MISTLSSMMTIRQRKKTIDRVPDVPLAVDDRNRNLRKKRTAKNAHDAVAEVARPVMRIVTTLTRSRTNRAPVVVANRNLATCHRSFPESPHGNTPSVFWP